MNPSSDQDFIAQVAQFSSLEQMQNMNTSIQSQQGFSMLGKHISAMVKDPVTGVSRSVAGQVSSVRLVSGQVMLQVGEDEVSLASIEKVSETADGISGTDSSEISKYNSFIGLMGTASIEGENGFSKNIDGIISKIEKTNKGVVATLDEVELTPTIHKGLYESNEAFLEAMKGRNVEMRVRDSSSGADVLVSGTLREFGAAEDGRMHVILDGVKTPVGDIIATRRVDLFSSEQMLLAQILQQLKANNAASVPAEAENINYKEGEIQ